MVARPTQLTGLTGGKVARLLIEDMWGELGVPAVLTTDQDSRFVSEFFLTTCHLLGIRTVFAQAHRPQANGRAEVAGKVLKDLLRKLSMEQKRPWPELVPIALRIRHDLVDPEVGFSPYQLVFGRERAGSGPAWFVEHESPEAQKWLEKRREVEVEVAERLRGRLEKKQQVINKTRREREFKVGDWVYLRKPKEVAGPGLEPFWTGPFEIRERRGEHSYVIKIGRSETPAHASQLKLLIESGERQGLRVSGAVCREDSQRL